MDFIKEWFGWFEDGAKSLDNESREKLFASCGQNCAKSGIIYEYKRLFDEHNGLDGMFSNLKELGCVHGDVIKSNSEYEIVFEKCLCDMHTNGYINSPVLCECSRQSVSFVMGYLVPDKSITVTKMHTVLEGMSECRFKINVGDKTNAN